MSFFPQSCGISKTLGAFLHRYAIKNIQVLATSARMVVQDCIEAEENTDAQDKFFMCVSQFLHCRMFVLHDISCAFLHRHATKNSKCAGHFGSDGGARLHRSRREYRCWDKFFMCASQLVHCRSHVLHDIFVRVFCRYP